MYQKNGQPCICHSASGNHRFLNVCLTVCFWYLSHKRKSNWKYSLVNVLRGTLNLHLYPSQLRVERCHAAKAMYVHKAGTKVINLQEVRLEKIVFGPTAYFSSKYRAYVHICIYIYIDRQIYFFTLENFASYLHNQWKAKESPCRQHRLIWNSLASSDPCASKHQFTSKV